MPTDTAVRCLLAVARRDSFTKAAEELYMTRQAVSQQIAALEKELGVKLFTRTTAKVTPTPAGELYIRFFDETLRHWDTLRRKVDAIQTREGELVRVGCLYATDLGDRVLELTERSRSRGRAFDISWERREAHELLELLLDDKFDVAFVFDKAFERFRNRDKVDHFTFERGQAMVTVRRGYPVARPEATAKDFEHEPCFLAEGMQHNEQARAEFLDEFAACGIHFTNVRVVPNRETLQTMVETGRGFTICMNLERFTQSPNLVTYPIERYQNIYCVWRRSENRPQVLEFVKAMRGGES